MKRGFLRALQAAAVLAVLVLTFVTWFFAGWHGAPSLSVVRQSCRVETARATGEQALVRLEPMNDRSRLSHLLLGDIAAGDYVHFVFLGEGLRAYRVTPGRSRRLGRLAVAAGAMPVWVSRQGGFAHVYLAGKWLCDTPVPSGLMTVTCAWDKALPSECGYTVRVQANRSVVLSDDFMRESFGRNDAWKAGSGTWWIEQEAERDAAPNAFVLQVSARQGAGRALTGNDFWNNYLLECSLSVDPKGALGLIFGQGRDGGYGVLLRDDSSCGVLELARFQGAKTEVLARKRVAPSAKRWLRLGLELAERRPVRVLLDGVPILQADLDSAGFGRVGLWAEGTGRFDDFSICGLAERPDPHAMRPVVHYSKTFKDKPPFPEDNRDERLQRWASDTDAWTAAKLALPGQTLSGVLSTALLFGDFQVLPAKVKGRVLLALQDAEGHKLFSHVLEPSAEAAPIERSGDELLVAGRRVGSLSPGEGVRVGVYAAGPLPAAARPQLLSRTFAQEFFETAPTGWLPVSGKWSLTNRWQCKPVWNWFGGLGTGDVILFSKDRYEGSQCHEFYYGMKDLFGREGDRRRYARHDVNFSFCTDGRDLASGYSVVFGAEDNATTRLMKGGLVVAQNDRMKFDPSITIDDLHLFWRRFRVEKLGPRIRVMLDDDILFDWTDPAQDAPTGGHIALWTYRNGIVYGRINSSAERVVNAAAEYLAAPGESAAGGWSSLDAARVRLEPGEAGRVRVRDLFGGGPFAVRWRLNAPANLDATPVLRMPFRAGEGAQVNLHAVVGGRPMIFAVNAPTRGTYEVLGDEWARYAEWEPYASDELRAPAVEDRSVLEEPLGRIQVDLRAEVRRRYPRLGQLKLTSLILGNTSNHGYLMAGFGGNTSRSWYEVGPVEFLPAVEAPPAQAAGPPAPKGR